MNHTALEFTRSFRAFVCLSVSTLLVANLPDRYREGYVPSRNAIEGSFSESNAKLTTSGRQLPLVFEENQGQTDPEIKFLSRGRTFDAYLKSNGVLLTFPTYPTRDADQSGDESLVNHFLSLKMEGANYDAQIIGEEILQSSTNYFVGNDRQRWLTDVHHYEKVRYEEAYPGIDVVYYRNQLGLEYDFRISPGADYKAIVLSFHGAETIAVDTSGTLVLGTVAREIRQHKPFAYQELDGVRRELTSRYVVLDGEGSIDREVDRPETGRRDYRVSFEVEDYDPALPLVIDPVLSYSSYLGGSARDEANAVAVDSSGNVYVVGYTNSTNFPMITTSQIAPNDCLPCGNVFITKLNPKGTAILYTTVLGGSLSESAKGVSVDSVGNAYITGYSFSKDFPVTAGAFQTNKRSVNGTDVFVTKLNSSGNSLSYSTYLGGSRNNQATSLAVDPAGAVYVTGYTYSDDFPTTANAFQTSRAGSNPFFSDAFVTRLDPSGGKLSYSTYLGGSGMDQANSVAVDSSGDAYITGRAGPGFPTTSGAFQPEIKGGNDAFVTKLRSGDGALLYSTYLGGSSGLPDDGACIPESCPVGDHGLGIAVDHSGNAYVTGQTSSSDFPSTPESFHADLNSIASLFLTKLNPEGNALVYSAVGIGGVSVAVDFVGSAYVAGTTLLDTIPMVSPFQGKRKGGVDAYIAKLDPTGSILLYSSYLGGGDHDFANGIAVDAFGTAYVIGNTISRNFKVTNAFQPIFGGQSGGTGAENGDAFVARIAVPRIISAVTIGKRLFVSGENFDDGAVILINGQKQKTANDEQQPASLLIGKKAARQVLPGQSVILQVRNSDGTLSAEFIFTLPI
jgi:hypothetical protein